MRCLTGLLRATRGSIRLKGDDITACLAMRARAWESATSRKAARCSRA